MADIITVDSPFMTCNMPKYHADELMYSYLMRVAVSNGFSSFDDFLKYTICDKKDINKFYKRTYIDFDCMKRESDCFEFANNHNWLISGTLYKGIAPLQSEDVNCNRLKEYYNNGLVKITPGHVTGTISALRVCPECKAEEGEDWYYHTRLQMPFVSFCPVHGCRLLSVNPLKGNIITSPEFMDNYSNFSRYVSDFCVDLFDADLQCNGDDLARLLKSCIDIPVSVYRIKFENDKEKADLIKNVSSTCIRNLLRNLIPPPYQEFILLLRYFFNDVKEIEAALPRIIRYDKELFLKEASNKYELLGEFRSDVVHVRCLNCGAVFFINPGSVINNTAACYECSA